MFTLKGFDAKNWKSNINLDKSVTFSYLSKDGEEGYPGDVSVFAKYTLSPVNGALQIEYTATTTEKTPINIANHMYFNLAGHGTGSEGIYQHTIQINANAYTPVDAELIPTGAIDSVQDSPFDFRVPRLMGEFLSSK